MSPEDLESTAMSLFSQACNLPVQDRAEFLNRTCEGEPALREKVEAMLSHDPGDTPLPPASFNLQSLVEREEGSDPRIGSRIGPYLIKEKIGKGGMGVVYKAERQDPYMIVALKLVAPHLSRKEILNRMKNERQVLADLSHPHIARFLDAGATDDGRPYFVMEYVEGMPITKHCDACGLNVVERLRLFARVCSAVHYAHGRGVIHRDLSPMNILITDAGDPKLIDFGIAKVVIHRPGVQDTEAILEQQHFFNPVYASPEHIRGETPTAAMDIYSLGAILYELLTGQLPFALPTRIHQLVNSIICTEEPLTPSEAVTRAVTIVAPDGTTHTIEPEEIAVARKESPRTLQRRLKGGPDSIIMMALHKEPDRRFRSADQFARNIDCHLAGLPIDPPSPFWYRKIQYIRRHKVSLLVVSTITVLLVAALVATSFGMRAAKQARLIAETKLIDEYEEQGRSTFVQGRPSTAITHLARAYQLAPDRQSLRFLLGNAIRQSGLILRMRGHSDEILAVTFNASADMIATAGKDKTASVWSARMGARIATFAHDDIVERVWFGKDGTTLFTRTHDGAVCIWAYSSGERLKILSDTIGPSDTTSPEWFGVRSAEHVEIWTDNPAGPLATLPASDVTFLRYDQKSGRVITAGSNNRTTVWDVATCTALTTLTIDTARLSSAAFSPDGTLLASVCTPDDKSVTSSAEWKLWDAVNGSLLGQFDRPHIPDDERHPYIGRERVVFGPDGSRVAFVNKDASTVVVYDSRSRLMLYSIPLPAGVEGGYRHVQFSSDSSRMLVTTARWDRPHEWFTHLDLYDAANGRHISSLGNNELSFLWAHFVADGGRVMAGGWDGVTRLWRSDDGGYDGQYCLHSGEVTCAALDREGRMFVTGSSDGTAALCALAPGRKSLGQAQSHVIDNAGVDKVEFSPSGDLILVKGTHERKQGGAAVWAIGDGRLLREMADCVKTAWVGTTGQCTLRMVHRASEGNSLLVYDARTNVDLCHIQAPDAILAAELNRDGTRLITIPEAYPHTNGQIRLWDAVTGVLLADLGNARHAALSPDGTTVAVLAAPSASTPGLLRLVDARTGVPRGAVPVRDEQYIAFGSNRIAVVDGLSGPMVWNLDTLRSVPIHLPRAPSGNPIFWELSPDAAVLATAVGGGEVGLWRTNSGECVVRSRCDNAASLGIVFSPDARLVAIRQGRAAQFFDAKEGRIVGKIEPWKYEMSEDDISFSPDGDRVIVEGSRLPPTVYDVQNLATPVSSLNADLNNAMWLGSKTRWNPTHTQIVATLTRDRLYIWDTDIGRPLMMVKPPKDATCMAWGPSGDTLAVAGRAGELAVWDIQPERRSPTEIDEWVRNSLLVNEPSSLGVRQRLLVD